jgi:hypothetical protein
MKKLVAVAVILFFKCNLFSQVTDSVTAIGEQTYTVDPYSAYTSMYDTSLVTLVPKHPISEKRIAAPTIGIGIGLFSFYGDVLPKSFQSPTTSRTAYEISLTQPLNDYFFINFNMLYGKLGANERFTQNNRNVNFESEIRAGSLTIGYNFAHFIKTKRLMTPYVLLGIESFEFLSKTDLYDKNGNLYHYWSDGTIRSMDENAPNANTTAQILKRDYIYESDVRETNVQKFGKYPERSFAIPVGGGFLFHVNDFIDFRISTILHFTFTDYIDGIVEKNTNRNIIKGKNDYFLMSSCGLSYNFGIKQKTIDPVIEKIDTESADFFVMDTDDKDKDGVPDIFDKCQNTPQGVEVDSLGCPLDSDKDGIPDYRDKEINSPKGSIVDNRGVALNDSTIALYYKRYTDSTAYATIEELEAEIKIDVPDQYIVSLGSYDRGIPIDLLTKFLSIHDIQTIKVTEKKSMYTAGTYNNLGDATTRKQQLIDAGLTNAIVMINENGVYRSIQTASKATSSKLQPYKTVKAAPKPSLQPQQPIVTQTPSIVEEKTTTPTPIVKVQPDTTTKKLTIEHPDKPKITDTAVSVEFTPAKPAAVAVNTQTVAEVTSPDVKTQKDSALVLTPSTPIIGKKDTATSIAVVVPKTEITNNVTSPTTKATIKQTEAKENEPTIPIASTTPTVVAVIDDTPLTAEEKKELALLGPEIVYRVQLGAYPIPLSQNVFAGLKDVVEISTENGLYKYTSNSFKSMEAAAKFRIDMILRGYEGAFITAYKGGERITLEEAGAKMTSSPSSKPTAEISDTVKINVANKNLISFKVQVGIYKGAPPADKMKTFDALKSKGLVTEKTITGLTRYVIGSFTSYLKAEEFRYELIKKYDLTDPFVVAQFNDEYITVQEALELLK